MAVQWRVLKRAALKWWDDNAPRLRASLSYYTLFSLAPMLIIVIAVAGMIFGQEAVEGRLMEEIQGLVGRESALAIQSMIQHARHPEANTIATMTSLIAMVVLLTGVFVELQDALNLIWRIPPRNTLSGARDWISSHCIARLVPWLPPSADGSRRCFQCRKC
jgi:membrane protein